MKQIDIVRAWKDQDFRDSLSSEDRASLPANPAGMVELSDADLGKVSGGASIICTMVTGRCDTPCTWPSCK